LSQEVVAMRWPSGLNCALVTSLSRPWVIFRGDGNLFFLYGAFPLSQCPNGQRDRSPCDQQGEAKDQTDKPIAPSAPLGGSFYFAPQIAAPSGDGGQNVVGKLDPPDSSTFLAGKQPGIHQPGDRLQSSGARQTCLDQFMRCRIDRGTFAKAVGAEQAVLDEGANGSGVRAKTPFVKMFEDVFCTSFELLRPDDTFLVRQPLFVQLSVEQAEQRWYSINFCQWYIRRDAGYKPDNCATSRLRDERRNLGAGAATHRYSPAEFCGEHSAWQVIPLAAGKNTRLLPQLRRR
jgi:hypothetical protein